MPAGQSCSVATGAFDTHADEPAKATQPGQEFLVATWCGGEFRGAQKPTSSTKRGNGVTILVGVNAADDLRVGFDAMRSLLFPCYRSVVCRHQSGGRTGQ